MISCVITQLAAGFLAGVLTLLLRVRPASLTAMTWLMLDVLIVQAWMLGSGLAGRLDVRSQLFIAVGALLISALLIGICRRAIVSECRFIGRRCRAAMGRLGVWRIVVMMLIIGGMLAWCGATGWLVGPYLPDVTTYHLAPPADWVANGRIESLRWLDSRANWPQGQGLLAMSWMNPLRELRAGVLGELPWLVLAAATAWAWVRQLGGGVRWAWLAACLTAGVPVAWAQATSGLNDFAVATLMFAAMAPLLGRSVKRGQVWVTLLAIVLAMGVKPTTMFMFPAIVLLIIARRIGGRFERGGGRSAIVIPLFMLAVCVSGFWYGRNAMVHQNPLYPAPIAWGDRVIARGNVQVEGNLGGPSIAKLKQNVGVMVTDRMWDVHKLRDGLTPRASGFGLLASGAGTLAMLVLLFMRRRMAMGIIAMLIMVVCTAAAAEPDIWNGRFFSVYALVGVVAAVMLGRVMPWRFMSVGWALALIGLGSWGAWRGIDATVPPLAKAYWQEHGLSNVPDRAMLFHDHAWMLDKVAEVPEGLTIAITGDGPRAPVALMHGEHLDRKLFYYPAAMDPYVWKDWRDKGVAWLIPSVPESELGAIDRGMRGLGLYRFEDGLYGLP
ncbi:MAG: hypothetical protein GC162_17000 [Planctomycetes bacterium]|nr:hypothetical protein [Planctomycetota bacterium]